MTVADSMWDWLAGTYWYVPTENLLAFITRPAAQQAVPVADQTVFHITDYRNGYFRGDTVSDSVWAE